MSACIASVLACLMAGMVPLFAQQPAYPFKDPALAMEKRIDNLLSLMTIGEKVDCLGTRTGVPRLGVPNFGSSEGIHGVVQRGSQGRINRDAITTTQFPQPPGMGESWDPDLVRQAGGVQGYEARFITQTEKYNRQILMLPSPLFRIALRPVDYKNFANLLVEEHFPTIERDAGGLYETRELLQRV